MRLRTRVRLFWQRLWIRTDEFDHTLDMLPAEEMIAMTRAERDAYLNDLVRRRDIAHERSMPVRAALLRDGELDYWVARAVGREARLVRGTCRVGRGMSAWWWPLAVPGSRRFAPSRNWAEAGPLIQREAINLMRREYARRLFDPGFGLGLWLAAKDDLRLSGDTPQAAAMRCLVAARLGASFERAPGKRPLRAMWARFAKRS